MLLPATHFHSFTFTSSSSSSSFFSFPFQFPNSKSLTPSKFIIRSSTSEPHTLPEFAIQRIADKLHSLGIIDKSTTTTTTTSSTTAGDIFVPLPHQLPKQRVGHTIDKSWSTPENPGPLPGTGIVRLSENELERQRIQKKKEGEEKRRRVPTLAELSLTDEEIRRLTELGLQLKQKLKVGKAGVTEGIVNGIHERWRRSEVVRIVCEDICKINMKRTHDILERKTGGIVVKRSGSKIILYRGINYKYPYFLADKVLRDGNDGQSPSFKAAKPALIQGVGIPNKVRFQLPGEAELVEEADSLLEGLGPRFTDWWGLDPVPVDADLLPAVIRGFRQPFRLLPYGVKAKLTDDEITTLKRLGSPLPCHFALGRNRRLQGLAAAIIKLWERCEIAKIAVKRGVENTSNMKMAEEIKVLEKNAKTEELIARLEKAEGPHEQEIDKEGINEEERYMLQKIGLKMKPFLLLGDSSIWCLELSHR